MPQVLDSPKSTVDSSLDSIHQLVLYNDDVNAVEDVIVALMIVLKHPIQLAKHLALECHRQGREVIEVGELDQLLIFKKALEERHLTVQIEKV